MGTICEDEADDIDQDLDKMKADSLLSPTSKLILELEAMKSSECKITGLF
jgi:hypothetical protein